MSGEAVPQKLLQNSAGTLFGSTWQGLIEYRKSDLELPPAAGYASPNQAIYTVNSELRPLPVGVPGEILIGGASVAAGDGKMDTTTEKFIKSFILRLNSNFAAENWTTKRTGLVEAAGGVLTNAVVTSREQEDDQFLAGYVAFSNAPASAGSYDSSAIVVLSKLPLDDHSELDRSAINQLPLYESTVVSSTSQEVTPMEASLAEVWQGVLPTSASLTLTPRLDFFRVGGTSLLIVILQRVVKEHYKVALPVTELVATKRLADMAHLNEDKGALA
ncbi:putative PKS/NRPS-like protein biosynthetic cluster [Aspergillus brasiliensis]|nr:putative PKS/NRPS-like protein biosynthetic cluster [Aspergillus brasiliensis]